MNSYETLKRFVSEATGFDPESTGEKAFINLIKSQMESLDIRDMDSYLRLMESEPEELERLYNRLAVCETWFFRDRGSFDFLKRYVGHIGPIKESGMGLRILSAPCSTGEEPYSIAITLLEAGLAPDSFQIDAADISKSAIDFARHGVYKKRSFRDEKHYGGLKDRYFSKTEGGFKVDEKVKKSVDFYIDNMVSQNFLFNQRPYHIIFCKNLFIYLTHEAREKVFKNIDRLLLPEGVLIVGHSEVMLCINNGYSPMGHPGAFACTKKIPDSAGPVIKHREKQGKKKAFLDRGSVGQHKDIIDMPVQGQKVDESILVTAQSLADRGALKEAYHLCEEFLHGHIDNKEVYYLMGLIQQALNHFERAETLFMKALYLDPFYYDALVHLYLLYEKKGETEKASVIMGRIKRIEKTDKRGIKDRGTNLGL
ncbi:MAG TPA: CheR family methyltransferase [Syntrophorhabdaceae bacterium]|nr:CheR family methyltransferase [Syntrophorhabdaceae bacterium]HOL05211.1 CheR family methyltransferase [Syntrophorhabdaceae bacterium]HPP41014.1 CheR family methyltransferase [Syntrophorhabdaceae bacterium]